MEATPSQVSRYRAIKAHFDGAVTRAIAQLVAIGDFAKSVDDWGSDYGFSFNLWTPPEKKEADKTVDAFNILSRVLGKVETGRYGVRFDGNDFDVLAPGHIKDDEITGDRWEGFDGWLLILAAGALIVAGVWGVSNIIKSRAETRRKELEVEIKKIDSDMISNPDKTIRSAWERLKKEEGPELKKAGIFDKIFGTGSGTALLAIGGGLLAISLLWSKAKR
jgi:hypothetical protein